MDRNKLTVEISRICGCDNAVLTAEIDTATNYVTYRLQTYQRGIGVTCRTFDTYSNAVMVFEDFCNTLNRR